MKIFQAKGNNQFFRVAPVLVQGCNTPPGIMISVYEVCEWVSGVWLTVYTLSGNSYFDTYAQAKTFLLRHTTLR